MTFIKNHYLQIMVSIMLFVAIASWPYFYYQILRWVVFVSAGIIAYDAFKNKKETWGWVFIVILILFNPIASIYFERDIWQILDYITGIIYLISMKDIVIGRSSSN